MEAEGIAWTKSLGAGSAKDPALSGSEEAEKKVESAVQETYSLCQALNLILWNLAP